MDSLADLGIVIEAASRIVEGFDKSCTPGTAHTGVKLLALCYFHGYRALLAGSHWLATLLYRSYTNNTSFTGFTLVSKKNSSKAVVVPESDERVERSKRLVLATTHELLTQSGLSGVSVDEVSRRSGVAKTTIYRHWPSRHDLLMDACRHLSARPQAPDTGSLAGDLELLAVMVAGRLRQAWASVLPSILDAAERDKNLAQLYAQIHSDMRSAFIVVIERARERGEVPQRENASEVVASVLGPLFYRRWFSRETLDESFAKGVVARVLRSLGKS
jgi:AcrR family transcriptional regulator